jgi:hypothetical protein
VPLFGDFFKQIQQFDMPGADIGILKPGAPASGHYIGVRFVSSAARAVGKQHVQVLMDPLLGGWRDEKGRGTTIPLDALTHCVNMLFYNGVNHLTTYGPWDKYHPDQYERFNLYAGRLACLLRDATNAAQVAIYYPLETFQGRYRPTSKYIWDEPMEYHDLQASVLNIVRLFHDNSIDYNFLNAEAIEEAKVDEGALTQGCYHYKVLLMPSMDIVPLAVLKKIRRFEAAGGLVLWTGTQPIMGVAEREDTEVVALMSKYSTVAPKNAIDAVMRAVPREFRFNAALNTRKAILTSKYLRNDTAMHYVINSSTATVELTDIRCGDALRYKVYDPSAGTTRWLDSGGRLSLAPCRALVFVCGGHRQP